MFIYEKNNKLHIMLTGGKPATENDTPNIIIEQTDEGTVVKVDGVAEGASGTYILPAAKADTLGGIKADAKDESDTVPVKIGADNKLYVPTYPADLPFSPATADDLGCVIAAPAGETDTVEAKIGADNKLYVPTYPVVPEIPVAANMPASEAATVELLLADFNTLLAALKDAGLMASSEG